MSIPSDPRAEPPEQPKTAQIPAADKNEILLAELKSLFVAGQAAMVDRVDSGFRAVKTDMDLLGGNVELLSGQFQGLEQDVRHLQSWRVRTEDRQTASSMRAKAPSAFDLEQDAKLAIALSELAEERAMRKKLEETSATKADLESVAKAQTKDIVQSLSSAVERSPAVRKLLLAIAGLLFLAINTGTQYLLTKNAQQPAPPTQGHQ